MKQVHWLVAKQPVERRDKNKENQSVETKNWLLERKASGDPVYLHTFRTQYEVLGVEVPHAHIRTHSMHQILPISPFRTYFAHKLHIHLSYYHAPAHKNARESALPSSGPHTHTSAHIYKLHFGRYIAAKTPLTLGTFLCSS